MTVSAATTLEVADWRRRVFGLYSAVRQLAASDPRKAHEHWRFARDELFAAHPSTPLLPEDRAGFVGLLVAPYDPSWRFEVRITPVDEPKRMDVETGTDGVVPFEQLGVVRIPTIGTLDVWRLTSYGGGIFIPVRDTLAARQGGTYGGGRYLLDTIKGADLGPGLDDDSVILDFNFAYNPSCAYDPEWACPLAGPGNTLPVEVPVGERYLQLH